jgi:TPR repeat protein
MVLSKLVITKIQSIFHVTFITFIMTATNAVSFTDEAERRVALIIGVSNYTTIAPLKNTLNDGDLMAETLNSLDFDVIQLENPSLFEMRSTLKTFSFSAETADIALVYFAGHGLEFGGQNYLLPRDSEATSPSAAAAGSLSLDTVLEAVNGARQLRIVILDSCRTNPFSGNGDASTEAIIAKVETSENSDGGLPQTVRGLAGLAEPSPDRGTLVAFAAEAGWAALDGSGSNSPYTLALAENLKAADVEIGLVFRRVRDSVLKASGNRQVPHTYGSLSGNPYFLAGRATDLNLLEDENRKSAWARLDVEQVHQLEALAFDGDERALMGLAYMRLDPNAERFDPESAVKLLTQAADFGAPEAMYELGRLYETGIGTPQNTSRGLELYEQAANLDFADAINDLGFLTFQGGLGVTKNVPKALKYFERAAELKHPEAMYNFAALIDDGLVKNRDLKDAARFLYLGLRSGNEVVLNQLLESPNTFKREVRLELQNLLIENKLYSGAADASFGPQTNRGLRRAYGLED